MNQVSKFEESAQAKASAEMMTFLRDYSQLLDQHITTVRKILLTTVDQAMAGVAAINAAADRKLKMADEVLVKDQTSAFVSKSAKDLDVTYKDPAEKVKLVNETLSAHMSGLSNLDESVRGFLFAIMGGLSMDDVVRQRMEHLTSSLVAMRDGVQKVIDQYSSAAVVSDDFINSVQHEMLVKMYKSYTMEDEKKVFSKVFGKVAGINQKS
jgi:hypothetical protein